MTKGYERAFRRLIMPRLRKLKPIPYSLIIFVAEEEDRFSIVIESGKSIWPFPTVPYGGTYGWKYKLSDVKKWDNHEYTQLLKAVDVMVDTIINEANAYIVNRSEMGGENMPIIIVPIERALK